MSSTCDLDRKSDSWQNSKTPALIHNISCKNDSVCIMLQPQNWLFQSDDLTGCVEKSLKIRVVFRGMRSSLQGRKLKCEVIWLRSNGCVIIKLQVRIAGEMMWWRCEAALSPVWVRHLATKRRKRGYYIYGHAMRKDSCNILYKIMSVEEEKSENKEEDELKISGSGLGGRLTRP